VADAAFASKLAPTVDRVPPVGASLLAIAADQTQQGSKFAPTEQGISGRFDGLFFCLNEVDFHISIMHNQMNKYDLWIYESAVKVTPSKRDRKPRIANTAQGIV
jgi:hypothetical protein